MKECAGFKCEQCGKTYDTPHDAVACEQACTTLETRRRINEIAIRQRRQEQRERALEAARESDALRLLVEHGFETEARVIAHELIRFLLDWNCSSAMEELYDDMLKAAAEKK